MSLLQITDGYSGIWSTCMETRIAFFDGKGCNSFKQEEKTFMK
jgi:hypothetical protein